MSNPPYPPSNAGDANPGDANKIRKMFVDVLGVNLLGVGAHQKDGAIHYAYPVVALVGCKS